MFGGRVGGRGQQSGWQVWPVCQASPRSSVFSDTLEEFPDLADNCTQGYDLLQQYHKSVGKEKGTGRVWRNPHADFLTLYLSHERGTSPNVHPFPCV